MGCDFGLQELNSFLRFGDRKFCVFHVCSFLPWCFALVSVSRQYSRFSLPPALTTGSPLGFFHS